MACVYMHTVKENGKRYIGQSINSAKERWGSTGHRYKGQLFYYAIQKYGWDNITHEILAENISQEEADELEKEYISKYRTNEREFGYNLTPGGKDGAGMPGGKNHNARPVTCLETGEIWECSTYCARDIGLNLASLQESLYHGYKCKGLHYKYVDDDSYKINREPYGVRCIETGQVWKTVRECAAELGVHKRNIVRYCKKERKPKSGLTYEYCVM